MHHSLLAQYKRVLNTVILEGSAKPYLLLDGFLHNENCASLWKFDGEGKVNSLEITHSDDGKPCISFNDSGIEIYLFDKMDHAKRLALNEQLGRRAALLVEDLETLGRPLVCFIHEHRLLTSKLHSLGKRIVKSLRDPDIIPADRKGMTQMLSSLRPALAARARGAELIGNTDI